MILALLLILFPHWCWYLYTYCMICLFDLTDEVKKWLIWEYWTSPLMYALNALAVNEFLSPSWNEVKKTYGINRNPYIIICPLKTFCYQALPRFREPLGRLVLESRGVFPEAKWYWIGLGALLGYVLLFNILYTICLSILTCELEKKMNFLY